MTTEDQTPAEFPTGEASNPERDADIQALCDKPGEWRILSEHASVGAARVVKFRLRRMYGPGFEFAARKQADGSGKIHGRYVGDEDAGQVAP